MEHSTDVKIPVNDWLEKSETVSSKNRKSRMLNLRLDQYRSSIDHQIMNCREHLTPQIVRDMMNGCYVPEEERKGRIDFIGFALDHIRQRYDRGQIAYTTYDNGRLSILAFHGGYRSRGTLLTG